MIKPKFLPARPSKEYLSSERQREIEEEQRAVEEEAEIQDRNLGIPETGTGSMDVD